MTLVPSRSSRKTKHISKASFASAGPFEGPAEGKQTPPDAVFTGFALAQKRSWIFTFLVAIVGQFLVDANGGRFLVS